jgi:hypothetical protein
MVLETLVGCFCAFAVSLNSEWGRGTRRLPASPIPIPETQSTFHSLAQRNAFHRRDARPQRRSFALRDPQLRHSPTPTGFAEILGDYFPAITRLTLRSVHVRVTVLSVSTSRLA